MRRPVLGTLFALACVSILPASAGAITLTNHILKPHGITGKAERHQVVVTTVAPPDSDQDGWADSEDNCPHEPYSQNGGCKPEPVAVPIESVAPAPAYTEASYTSGYSIPSEIVMCESGGNWGAVNPSSGAGGAYQILPSTWAAYGGSGAPQDASPAEQSAIAAQIYADSGGAAWVC